MTLTFELDLLDIVACQAHPALVKLGLVLARLFHFNSLLVCIRLIKGLTARVSSRPGAMAVLRRPRPAGTRQYSSTYMHNTSIDVFILQCLQEV